MERLNKCEIPTRWNIYGARSFGDRSSRGIVHAVVAEKGRVRIEENRGSGKILEKIDRVFFRDWKKKGKFGEKRGKRFF